jgi:trk system potassium uptake protein TrkH
MGILIFIIAVLPALGVGGHRYASAEAPWASLNKMAPRTSDLAKLLYLIYISFTLLEFVLLSLSKMSLFEAIINSLGSVSTAGLLLHPDGVAFYDSFYAETVYLFSPFFLL